MTNKETTELLKKVRKIEIKTKGLSNQVFAGSYHSAFKGRGMSFSEVRSYTYGDDVRSIDWNVTARFNEPFVKVFEEERELTVMLLIDISKSAYFGTQNGFKRDINAEISAVLAFSAIQNNDKVGVIFFSNKVEKFIPPKKGKSHILLIIRELLNIKPNENGTNLGVALEYFNNVMKRSSIAFILSDFVTEDFTSALRISKKRHDIIGLHLYDKMEAKMPKVGLIKLFDAERMVERFFDTSQKSLREKNHQAFLQNKEKQEKTFHRIRADFLSIDTEENYTTALLQLFKRRGKRR